MSFLGGACWVSSENSNVVDLFDLKDCTGDVTSAHLKSCNIRRVVKNERKLLPTRAG